MIRTVAWLVFSFVAACSADRCDHYYANLSEYTPPSGAYRLRYQDPPWSLVGEPSERVELRIDRTQIVQIDAEIPSKYALVVDVDPGVTAAARIATEKAAALSRGERIIGVEGAVTTESGNVGVQFFSEGSTDTGARSYRYVAFDGASGAVHLFFEADPNLDNPEVDAMVRVFSVPLPEAP